MTYEMPKLPYGRGDLAPVISEETIDYHYGKHLQAYVDKLNELVKGTEFEGKTVEEVVRTAPDGAIYNQAGQIINHTIYFERFSPKPAHDKAQGELAKAIDRDFGSFDAFKKKFSEAAISLFGAGWAWLSSTRDGKLEITKETNAGCPLRKGNCPLLGIDVWEHAYYIDYRNARAKHVEKIWEIFDWDKISEAYATR